MGQPDKVLQQFFRCTHQVSGGLFRQYNTFRPTMPGGHLVRQFAGTAWIHLPDAGSDRSGEKIHIAIQLELLPLFMKNTLS